QLHNGSRHLTLRSQEGLSFLVPAWMVDREAASVKIVDTPCISIARLLDLLALLDSSLAFHSGERIANGGCDGESFDKSTEGLVQRATAEPEAWSGGARESARADLIALDGGDGNDGRSAGGGR